MEDSCSVGSFWLKRGVLGWTAIENRARAALRSLEVPSGLKGNSSGQFPGMPVTRIKQYRESTGYVEYLTAHYDDGNIHLLIT